MSNWSPVDAMALERRHVAEFEARVARHEALILQLSAKGRAEAVTRPGSSWNYFMSHWTSRGIGFATLNSATETNSGPNRLSQF